MTWFDWMLVALWSVGGLAQVAIVGQQRDPITPGRAAFGVLMCALLVVGLILTRTGL